MKSKTIKIILCCQFLTLSAIAQEAAQERSSDIAKVMTDPMNYIMVLTIAILLGTILVMARVIKLLTWQISGTPVSIDKSVESKSTKVRKKTIWTKLNKVLSDSVPVESMKLYWIIIMMGLKNWIITYLPGGSMVST